MTLQTARTLLVADRLDWTRPHLRWLSAAAYHNLRARLSRR